MSISTVVRGNLVIWEGNFEDNEGTAIVPDTTVLTVRYPRYPRSFAVATPSVTYDGTDLYAEFDTGDAYLGEATWSIKGTKDGKTIVEQGSFRIDANAANRVAESEP